MEKENTIWTYFFPMRKWTLDDYYFDEGGSILLSYDKTQQKLNIEECVSADSIPIGKRRAMIEACHEDKYAIIKSIIGL